MQELLGGPFITPLGRLQDLGDVRAHHSEWFSPPHGDSVGPRTVIQVGLAASFTLFVRIFQTRFLLFRLCDLRLYFLK